MRLEVAARVKGTIASFRGWLQSWPLTGNLVYILPSLGERPEQCWVGTAHSLPGRFETSTKSSFVFLLSFPHREEGEGQIIIDRCLPLTRHCAGHFTDVTLFHPPG